MCTLELDRLGFKTKDSHVLTGNSPFIHSNPFSFSFLRASRGNNYKVPTVECQEHSRFSVHPHILLSHFLQTVSWVQGTIWEMITTTLLSVPQEWQPLRCRALAKVVGIRWWIIFIQRAVSRKNKRRDFWRCVSSSRPFWALRKEELFNMRIVSTYHFTLYQTQLVLRYKE